MKPNRELVGFGYVSWDFISACTPCVSCGRKAHTCYFECDVKFVQEKFLYFLPTAFVFQKCY